MRPDETIEAEAEAAPARLPTSMILHELARDAPPDGVSLAWLVARLGERSFGVMMLLIALVALLPGTSGIVGLLIAVPASQMILGRDVPVLPGWIARRRFATARLAVLLGRAARVLERMERVVRPRWGTPFAATKRVVGSVILLLGITLLAPIPFSHVVPALVIAALAFAFLERDGVLLALALTAAAVSIAITAGAIWGTVEAGLLL